MPGRPPSADPLDHRLDASPPVRERAADLALAALLGAAVMAFLQTATPWLADNDSFYHVKMARLLPEVGFLHDFPWLHWTLFRDRFVSHHHGFHVLLAPFVWVSDVVTGSPVLGAKVACVAAMSLTLFVLCLILHTLGVRLAPLWLLVLACAPWHFWLRLSFIRAPMLALPLLLLALWLILTQRPRWLALTAFVLTQLYNGSVILVLLPAAFLLAALVRREPLRAPLRSAAAVLAGIAAGFILHPYFPDNLDFLRVQLFASGLGAPFEAGVEWRPYRASFFLVMSAPFLLIWIACLARRLYLRAPFTSRTLALLLLNVLFFALTCKSRRFIEYWPAFALLSAADLALIPQRPVQPAHPPRRPLSERPAALAALIAFLCLTGLVNLHFARRQIRPTHDPGAIRGAMDHLAQVSPAGSIVFTDDWDVFPYCFFWNHRNRYVVGLDPVFTMRPYPALWQRYRLITRGRTPAVLTAESGADAGRPVTLDDIRTEFAADYVLVAADHPDFYAQLIQRPDRFRLDYPAPTAASPDQQPPFNLFAVLDPPADDAPP